MISRRGPSPTISINVRKHSFPSKLSTARSIISFNFTERCKHVYNYVRENVTVPYDESIIGDFAFPRVLIHEALNTHDQINKFLDQYLCSALCESFQCLEEVDSLVMMVLSKIWSSVELDCLKRGNSIVVDLVMVFTETAYVQTPREDIESGGELESMQTKLEKGMLGSSQDDECVICLNELEVAATEISRMPCNHVFHRPCLSHWLQFKNVCPLCRFEV